MAVGDIWRTRVNCSTRNRAWSFGLYLEEVATHSDNDNGFNVAEAVQAHISTQLLGLLSDHSRLESVQAWRLWPGPARPGCVLTVGGVGVEPGDVLSNDNALFINLRQSQGDAKYNGGIYIAGMPELQMSDSKWGSTFLTNKVLPFTTQLSTPVSAVGPAAGTWDISVLSKAFIPAGTPVGTPLKVTAATATARVMSQRRRKQKVEGYSNLNEP